MKQFDILLTHALIIRRSFKSFWNEHGNGDPHTYNETRKAYGLKPKRF